MLGTCAAGVGDMHGDLIGNAAHMGTRIAQGNHQQPVGPTRSAQPQALCRWGWACDWNEGGALVHVMVEGCQGGRALLPHYGSHHLPCGTTRGWSNKRHTSTCSVITAA